MFYSFDDYWKQFGKYQTEIIDNPQIPEQVFYNLCKKIWNDAGGTNDETYESAHVEGYECCERENNLVPKENK